MPEEPRGFEKLGFSRNPFDHAEAENEPGLPSYYIKPPYYRDITGEPDNQRSWVILGDYGRGKSALRRKIELEVRADPADRIVCLTYDDFTQLVATRRPGDVTLTDHTDRLLALGVLALLGLVAKRRKEVRLDGPQREAARWFVKRYFETLSSSEAARLLDCVSTIDDKARREIRQHGKSLVNVIINAAIGYLGISLGIPLPPVPMQPGEPPSALEKLASENPLFLFEQLFCLLESLGVTSIVVLVDRVDQSGKAVADPDAIIQLLSPLLWNYNLLELKDPTRSRQVLGFKFFLPFEEHMRQALKQAGFRFDRVFPQEISWSQDDLFTMWRSRLGHFSSDRILDLAAVCSDRDIDHAIVSHARGSPRRMILMGHYVLLEFNEYLKHNPGAVMIPAECAVAGLAKFEKFNS